MHFSLLPASLLLAVVAAQTTTQSIAAAATQCADIAVLNVCLGTTEAIVLGCASTDYGCLCQKYNDVLTCFNNCPNDSRYSGILSYKDTYCADASVYSSSTSTPISAAVSTPVSAATTGSGSTSSGAVQVAGTTTGSAAAGSTGKSGASREMILNAGGLVMGVAGLVVAFL